MATHDYIIANASGAAVRADLNNALAAIVSNNSNASEPATTYSYQWWADTAAGQLKLRNSANDAWITIQELDGTMLMENGSAASPGLAFASDLDTGLLRPGANQFAISTAGNQRLVVDASGQVGIGETTPGTLVEINSETPYVTLKNSTQEDSDGGRESKVIFEGEQSGGEITTLAQIDVSHDGAADDQKGKIILSTNDGADGAAPTAALTIGSDQKVVASGDIQSTSQNGGQLAGFRNQIINGNFRVWQRGESFTGVTNDSYLGVDRFFIGRSSTAGQSLTKSTTAPAGFNYSCTLPSASTGIQYGVEIEEGSAGCFSTGSTWTWSVWSDQDITGETVFARFRDGVGNTVNSVNAATLSNFASTGETSNGFTRYSTTFIVSGSPNATNVCLNLYIGGGANRSYAGWQLEPSPVATPFEHRPIGTELALCQRYYYKCSRTVANAVLWATGSGNNTACLIQYPVPMRVAPSFPDSGSITFASAYGASSPYGTVTSLRDILSSGVVTQAQLRVNWSGSAPFQTQISDFQADAEL